MDRYLAQYADEALKALFTDEDLKTRLDAADALLHTPAEAHFDTAPQSVRDAIREVKDTRTAPLCDRATALRLAIVLILEQFGRDHPNA